jgi:hypothetical protein
MNTDGCNLTQLVHSVQLVPRVIYAIGRQHIIVLTVFQNFPELDLVVPNYIDMRDFYFIIM